LRVCTEYLAGSSEWYPLCFLFFCTVVFHRRLKQNSFVAEWAVAVSLPTRYNFWSDLPRVHEIVSQSGPYEVFMIMLEHIVKTYFSHLEALLEQVFA
jgi:hypothetical protein